MVLAIFVFAIVYFLLATEILEKSVSTLLGGAVVLIFGQFVLSPEGKPYLWHHASESVELNVIFLLIGMMTCVSILADTGFFEFIAIYVAKIMKGHAGWILVMLLTLTMVFSALLDNVTTIILLAPVTILITQLLELPSIPFLILEALASNIGGTATMIGDPPNIIIGDKVQLSFMDFILNLTPIVLILGVVFIFLAWLFLRKKLEVKPYIRQRVIDSYPSEAIIDRPKMYKSLAVFGLIFIAFSIHHLFHLQPGIIALGGMSLMLVVCKSDAEKMFETVEWDAILFFIGLFIMIGALEHTGAIDKLADMMINLCGDDRFFTCVIVLAGSAFFSAILDNIPFVIAMTPLVQKLIISQDWVTDSSTIIADQGIVYGSHPLFWALALGACLGGNGTLVGASANIVAAKVGDRNGCPITFIGFMRYGIPTTIITVVIAIIYMKLRYF